MIIGITGTPNSGKDTVAKLLIDKTGWPHFSISDELRRIAAERGLAIDNTTLGNLGNELRTQFGVGYLAEQGLAQYPDQNLIVTSIRNAGEIKPLQATGGFVLIAVDAPVEQRYARALARARAGEENLSLEEFEQQEKIMLHGPIAGQRIADLVKVADYRLHNTGTLADLEQKIDEILSKVQ